MLSLNSHLKYESENICGEQRPLLENNSNTPEAGLTPAITSNAFNAVVCRHMFISISLFLVHSEQKHNKQLLKTDPG